MKSLHELIREPLRLLKRAFGGDDPDSPDDPYALVGAPRKPKPPGRRAAAVVEPE
jgi:hypothetical protein